MLLRHTKRNERCLIHIPCFGRSAPVSHHGEVTPTSGRGSGTADGLAFRGAALLPSGHAALAVFPAWQAGSVLPLGLCPLRLTTVPTTGRSLSPGATFCDHPGRCRPGRPSRYLCFLQGARPPSLQVSHWPSSPLPPFNWKGNSVPVSPPAALPVLPTGAGTWLTFSSY